MELAITSSPGTFNDLSARIIANHLARDTGANVIANTRKGAGGLGGMNYVYTAEPDGLTLATVASVKLISNKVMDEPVAEYELEDFSYLMSIDHQPYCFMVSPEGPYQSVADLQAAQDLIIGGGGPAGPAALGGLSIIKLLNLDAVVVTGFIGEANRAMAVERGEIVGYVLNIPNARGSIEAGMVKPLFIISTERTPLAPEVPAITELVSLSGQDMDMVNLWATTFSASNLLTAPPDMPADRLAFLRELAEQWIEDEAFRQEIDEVAGYQVQTYLTGEEVHQAIMATVAKMDQFRAIFTELIEQYRA